MGEKENLAFCQKIVDMLKDGGCWVWPNTGDVYQIDRKAKTLTVILFHGNMDAVEESKLWFGKIGWTVLVKKGG